MLTLNGRAQAILPEGVEANVLGPSPGDQVQPSASLAAEGGILVWQDSRVDGAGSGIAAVRLDAGLSVTGEPFRVNARAEGEQQRPRVALLEGGGVAFVWSERNRGLSQVYARFQGADGSFSGPDIVVAPPAQITSSRVVTNVVGWKKNRLRKLKHTLRGGTARHREMAGEADVIPLPGGGAAVVYSAVHRSQTHTTEIVTEVTLNNGRPSTNDVLRPVVVQSHWMKDVFVQVFAADGQKTGDPVLVNQHVADNQHQPAVALLGDGRFVVVWVSEINAGVGLNFEMPVSAVAARVRSMRVDIRGRLFAADGLPLGDEFVVSDGVGTCFSPAVAPSPGGGFVVVWSQ
ncbi:MAG TPA: hypothetical protein VNO52_13335, partial [Methylomirabilota bacterium]|nr:hypothetical protein [Methylomirabilota bacterium]